MKMYKGIDISGYNPVADYGKVAKAVNFAILKIIRQDGNMDKLFTTHLNGCRANGLHVQGVYNYSYATSVAKAQSDAQKVVAYLKQSGLSCAVWLDVEDTCQKGLGQKLIDIVLAYKAVIDAAGYPFGIYTGLSFYNSYFKPFQAQIAMIPMWVARYPSTAKMDITKSPDASKNPNVPNEVAWQYTSKAVVPGINGVVDANEFYGPLAITDSAPVVAPTVSKYYPKYTGATNTSLISGLKGVGEKDTSYNHRAKIAAANGITNYKGTAAQNLKMLSLLKEGKLIKA